MKILMLIISLAMIFTLCLLPLIPSTSTISYTTKVPEQYTVTETYTDYVPKVGERAIWNESPAYREWRTSVKTDIENIGLPSGLSGYFSIEQFTYMKPVTKERQVTKMRLVDEVISIEIAERISVIEWMAKN